MQCNTQFIHRCDSRAVILSSSSARLINSSFTPRSLPVCPLLVHSTDQPCPAGTHPHFQKDGELRRQHQPHGLSQSPGANRVCVQGGPNHLFPHMSACTLFGGPSLMTEFMLLKLIFLHSRIGIYFPLLKAL